MFKVNYLGKPLKKKWKKKTKQSTPNIKVFALTKNNN